MLTRWGQSLDPEHIKPEYPRPRLRRDSYLNLNGRWSFCVNRSPVCETYDSTILVPFPPEAPLSGIGRTIHPEDYLHYRRKVNIPEQFFRGRILLHFGAVDQECAITVNGKAAGRHRGGYLPFTFDITDAVTPGENTITLCARDATEYAPYARGKQKLVKKGHMSSIFYTPCSGIWKTVWLESVPEHYIQNLLIIPDYKRLCVQLRIETNAPGDAAVEITFHGTPVWQGRVQTDKTVPIILPVVHPWTPEEPNLYDVTITYGEDTVRSYFGLRSIEVSPDSRGIPRFYLNEKPIFFNGVLDQGYWPDGLLTAPSEDALQCDILAVKRLGYNTIRIHVKIEEERFYYLCDRLGLLVWQDMPNGGGDYNMTFVTYLPNFLPPFGRVVRDRHYRLFSRRDARGRAQFYVELEGMVRLLEHFPSIVLWTPFNEGWGQFDAAKATARIRAIDPTRLINEACGWFDQGGGDLFSIHNYLRRLSVRPKPPRVVALTECGGYAYPVPGHTQSDKAFGYKQSSHSREELTAAYARLFREEILPNLRNGLSSQIYTQLSDIEEEVNGLLTYDREVVKVDETTFQNIHNDLYEAFEQITG